MPQSSNHRFTVTIDGRPYDVEVHQLDTGTLEVTVNGKPHTVSVEEAMQAARPEAEVRAASTTPAAPRLAPATPRSVPALPGVLTAPMPGDIVAVNVKAGDTVSPGQQVCVLEAMKMKNILRASQPGLVASVEVAPGQSVEYGAVLVRFE